jgi:hypothetical protein
MFARLKQLAAAYFILVAVLQYNDPDPWGWIAIYLAAAIISLLQRREPQHITPPLLLGALAALWALTLLPGAQGVALTDLPKPMHTRGGTVELAREVGGLTILALWMFVLSFHARRNQNK